MTIKTEIRRTQFHHLQMTQIKLVGGLVGLGAASVGIRLGFLGPGPIVAGSLLLCALIFTLTVVGPIRFLGSKVLFLDLALLAYAVIRLLVEIFNAADLSHSVSSPVFIEPFLNFVCYFTARHMVTSLEGAQTFARALYAPVFLVVPIAAAQVLQVPGISEILINFTSSAGFERRFTLGYEIRGTSTVGHHTQLAGYLLALTAVICTDLIISKRLSRRPLLPLLALGAAVFGQVTTLTFATAGATAIVILVTFAVLGIKPLPLIAAVGSATIALRLFGTDFAGRVQDQQILKSDTFSWLPGTVAFRAEVWINETVPAIASRPLTGWGHDVYQAVEKGWPYWPSNLIWISPESEYMRVLITGGAVSLFAEILLFIAVSVVLFRAVRVFRDIKIAIPALFGFVLLLVISSIHNHFSAPGAPFVLWALVGIITGLLMVFERSDQENAPHLTEENR